MEYKIVEGVYFLLDGNDIVYIGSSKHVHLRVDVHARNGKVFDRYIVLGEPCFSTEKMLIRLCCPKYNILGNPKFQKILEEMLRDSPKYHETRKRSIIEWKKQFDEQTI